MRRHRITPLISLPLLLLHSFSFNSPSLPSFILSLITLDFLSVGLVLPSPLPSSFPSLAVNE